MKDALKQYIEQKLLSGRGTVAVADDDNLLASGLVDSVGMMSLVLFIEEDLGMRVPPEDVTLENFVSVSAIDAYLRTRADGA